MKNSNKIGKSILSDKLTLTDVIPTDKKKRTIQELINKSPLYLWRIIHTKHSRVSLVRNAYGLLKIEVTKKRPDLVDKANKEHEINKLKKIAAKELRNGILGGEHSRFKKISSTKIIK
jgi:hypothetical protein